MSHTPLITAVLFVYNEESFIGEMLTSIQQQELPVSAILVVDDFSTDNTVAIIKSFAEKDPRITYVANEQKGKVYAYLSGLKRVKTAYFFISAGDDILFSSFTSTLYNKYIQERNLEFCYSLYSKIYPDGKVVTIEREAKYDFFDIIKNKSNPVSGYLFGKSAIIPLILENVDPLIGFEDWVTAAMLSRKYGSVAISEEPLFYYRQHAGNVAKTIGFRVALRNLRLIEHLQRKLGRELSKNETAVLVRNHRNWQYYYVLNRVLAGKPSLGKVFKIARRYNNVFSKDTAAIVVRKYILKAR